MKLLLTLAPALAAASAIRAAVIDADAPTKTLGKRATTICGQWDSVVTGTYTLYQDLWGKDAATSGSQCSTFNSLSGNNIAWSTSWSWQGGNYNVKSYANVVVKQTTGYQISTISSIPSTWKYSYTGSGIVANVAYDIFTSSSPAGSEEYEVMIWLAALGGAGPISATGSTIATPSIAGSSWKLYSGQNGQMKVFSFVASSQITNFSGDLKAFIDYLTKNQGLSTSQYVKSIGAGTEPFVGSNAVKTTTQYSVVINLGGTSTNPGGGTTTTPGGGGGGGTVPLYGQCGGTGYTGPTTCASGTCKFSNEWYSQCL